MLSVSESLHSLWARVGLNPLQLYVQIEGTHKNEKSEGRSCQSHIPKSLIRFFKVITAETISLRNISRSFNEDTSH